MARKLDPAKHEAKRQQILEAAISCFAKNGFHQTTTAQICTAVGMSSGNLFHYFDSKEAIIETIVAEERRETAAYFAELGAADDQFGAVLGFVDASLELATDPTYARLVLEIASEAIRNPAIHVLVRAADQEIRAGIADLLRKGMERGQIDANLDAERAATWIAALIDGVFSRLAVDPDFRPLEEADMMHLIIGRFLSAGHSPGQTIETRQNPPPATAGL
ncbi:TetR/AcrR family transcriptional regulator [Agrobacterium sp. NPDC089420]|uniref:TetR/AcrR family transcriptional regulator n=1 Tax=Agrobacterium sp. NPDC089420 TaxID=3363918 RepID=UPI00384A6E3E